MILGRAEQLAPVGCHVIDEQHRRLFALAGRLTLDASANDKDEAGGEAVLADLLDYTHSHFRDEEEFMRLIQYPGLRVHQQAHASIFAGVDQLLARMRTVDRQIMRREIGYFISEWLVRHVLHDDLQYTRYIRDQVMP